MKKIAAAGLSAIMLTSVSLPIVSSAQKNPLQPVSISSIGLDSWNKSSTFNKDEKQKHFSEDTLVIKYSKPLTAAEHKLAGTTVISQFPEMQYAIVKVKDKSKLQNAISTYQKFSKVKSVSPSVLYSKLGFTDPKASEQYHLSMLNIAKAQSLAGKNKVIVAVIDTGMDKNHPELKNALLPGYNAANPMNQPAIDMHGTHVAGIIAAEKNNGVGGYGVNPYVKILPVDVFDRGWGATDYSIAQGIDYAVAKGAKVINMSLGGPFTSPIIEESVKKAIDKGVVVVAAAGNEASDWVSYPAGYEGVISVGSINKEKKLSYYSNYGTSVDIVAPGEEVYSTVYDYEKKSSFIKASGTSMASPVVAGVAALLLTKYPNLTPAQVEYVLEHTATDLGSYGFDEKFANGLVDPVGALSFDMEKVPSFVKENWNEEEILQKAEVVTLDGAYEKKGTISNPFEQKWIKFDVKEGQSIQTILETSAQYDYKLMVHFYADGKKTDKQEINGVTAGKTEGKLLKAPFTGTLAIGVKDVNGSYSHTSGSPSEFTLKVLVPEALPVDESTVENMISITSLPYLSSEPLKLIGDGEDADYFTFSTQENQVVQIENSGVPGVNIGLEVYRIDGILPPAEEGSEITDEEKAQLLKEALEGKEPISPMYVGNTGGKGEGDRLTFSAEAGASYILKVTNKANNQFGFYDFLFFGGETNNNEPESSLIPYSIKIDGKILPEDEDTLPASLDNEEEGMKNEEKTEEVTLKKQFAAIKAAALDPWIEENNKRITKIMEAARPFQPGDSLSGYLQNMEDEDYMMIEASETAIYEFNLANKENKLPMMEILQVVEEKDDEGNTILVTNYVGSNVEWDWAGVKTSPKLFTGLREGEKYLIALRSNYYGEGSSFSFEPYELTANKVVDNPEDSYEDNDSFKDVKHLPSSSFSGNFAMPNDTDVFYYQSTITGIKSISVEAGKATDEMKQKYPNELLGKFHGIAVIIPDLDFDRNLDDNEMNSYTVIEKGQFGYAYGSFMAEKHKNYFVLLQGYIDSSVPMTLLPYTFKMNDTNLKDEDANTKVPLKLKKESRYLSTATGFFNVGMDGGDTDVYEYEATTDVSGIIKLESGVEIDGVISIYQNGKLIAESDYYAMGDHEALLLSLKKGKYQIKVKDANGNASVTNYKLKIYMK